MPFPNRWTTLFASIFTGWLAAAAYAFGLWSPTLKSEFDFSQTELQMVALAGNVGSYFGLVAGPY